MEHEASYVCASCGEELVVPVEPSNGHDQHYVEDCPVCCNPMELHVRFEDDGSASIDARRE